MGYPKAYAPKEGYKYQLLGKFNRDGDFEHIGYGVDEEDINHLMKEISERDVVCQFHIFQLPK
ncbi:hypothetical protein EV207_12550 [Scopulibacillus darangshiensis]|uniref:Uncharacterized protein n=1 Tax=Scopulibacillus darangshiensis TaxID=442528 RepID=A0A4R2NRD5_9BACL|nr:hypothetical protein [Scopulibacillus darangshiensis]TCP24489.1 hypothetical protein EV207_12550 [Scopulibacillus darangshiensis]